MGTVTRRREPDGQRPTGADGRYPAPDESRAQALGQVQPDLGQPPARVARRRATRRIALCLVAATFAALAFAAVNFVGEPGSRWYILLLGLFLGVAVMAAGIAAVLWGKHLIPREEAVEERHPLVSSAAEEEATQRTLRRAFDETGLRGQPLLRRLVVGLLGGFGVIAVVPLLNLVRAAPHRSLFVTRWSPGARLVTPDGRPVRLGDLAIGGMLTALPEGHLDVQAQADSAVVLVRLPPGLPIPAQQRAAAYADHVAFSKICTHAGCPVSMYVAPVQQLLCPCHQSVFDLADAARPVFGPATRALPQLPITVDDAGYFRARADFPQPVGPGFWSR